MTSAIIYFVDLQIETIAPQGHDLYQREDQDMVLVIQRMITGGEYTFYL